MVAPVPGTILVTSTSPISTPEFATNLPMAAVPAPRITVPIEFVPAGSAGNDVTSTSPISTPEFA